MAAQLFLTGTVSGATGTVGSTGTKAVSGVRSNSDGLNLAWAVYSVTSGTTLSTSDVINFMQLPEGAVVLDGYLCGIIKNGTGTVLKVGIGAAGVPVVAGASTDGDLLGSTTFSATRVFARFAGTAVGFPYQPAAIAAATYPKSYPVNVTMVSGTNTSSVSLCLMLIYTTAGQ